MTRKLIVIQVGPVQGFIQAARKTRDLWFGSWILSEISKSVARALVQSSSDVSVNDLIFPAPKNITDLEPSSTLTVPNIILAAVPAALCNAELIEKLESAAAAEFRKFAELAREAVGKAGRTADWLRADLWTSQVNDVVEVHVAWVALSEESGGYAKTRRRLMELLQARKSSRLFSPNIGREGVPKSSLDGARESVLGRHQNPMRGREDELPSKLGNRLRLQRGEQLDVIGLTKRLALKHSNDEPRFPSLLRIAADAWICRAAQSLPDQLDELKSLAQQCSSVIHGLPSDAKQYSEFPFEGTVLYLSRHKEFEEELSNDSISDRSVSEQLNRIRSKLSSMHRTLGAPSPYVAVLKADGDEIGKAIDGIVRDLKGSQAIERHRTFSQALSHLSARTEEIVSSHGGTLIYSGGDDVLALLPPDRSLSCAKILAEEFHQHLDKLWSESGLLPSTVPTLSIGVAIGHAMESLETLLGFAGSALLFAKSGGSFRDDEFGQRNALAVTVAARGNAEIRCRGRWFWSEKKDDSRNLWDRLMFWVQQYQQRAVPHRLPYLLRGLCEEVRLFGSGGSMAPRRREFITKAVRRMLDRRVAENTQQYEDSRVHLDEILFNCVGAEDIDRMASEVLVARRIWMSGSASMEACVADHADSELVMED